MKTVVCADMDRIERVCEVLCRTLREKPDAAIALSAEEDCLPAYRRLAERAAQREISLRRARFFPAAEFEGLAPEDERSCRNRLLAALRSSDATEGNIAALSVEGAERYEDRIALAGGLDLAVLGLGINARIGFNEPATPYDSHTHRQKLTPATRRELAALFGTEEQVPDHGLTMGIKTLVGARQIVVTAAGDGKAKAAFDMLYGRDDSTVPAAFLQLPLQVSVFLDEAAAAKL